jgi:hypothetical protein
VAAHASRYSSCAEDGDGDGDEVAALVFTTGGRESARTERGDEPQAETNSIPTVDARSAARVMSTGRIIARIGCLPTGNADMSLGGQKCRSRARDPATFTGPGHI